MLEEIEITCPSCGAEFTIEADDTTDEIACEECGYEFYPAESVGEE